MPSRRLYVVATVHLDTQWRWTVQDTIRNFIPATLERNFELLERYPFFVVSFEGAFRYQLMKEYYPQQFEVLRQWVEAGRWRPAGSMLDAPDVNIVAPESLLRHILYGNGFFEREFGVRSRDLFLPDCFGFGFALPSVAAHCGLIGFSGQKFGRWMAPATIPFDVGVWQGPDGAEIVAAIRPEGYGEGLREDLSQAPRFLERLDDTGRESGAYVGIKYVGVGDRGGGLDEESMEWLARSVAGEGPVKVVVSGSDQLYQELESEQIAALPRHRGELLLPTHGTGCLTSQAALKRWNRRNELLGDAAERAATMAAWLGLLDYPAERLQEAWTRFLWHQMHDDLTGTSIPAAYRFTDNDEILSLKQFATVLTHSMGALASEMDTRAEGQSVVVFNPLSIERCDVVTVDHPSTITSPIRVVGPNGRETPSQVGLDFQGRQSVVFLARVPPLGVQIYDLEFVPPGESFESDLEITPSTMANHRYRIEIDDQGDILSVLDRRTGRQLLAAPIRWELIRDRSARWPAWEILYEDLQEKAPGQLTGTAEIRVLEEGPVRVALEVRRSSRRSTYTQILRLAAGDAGDRIEIANQVDWYTRGRLLKARFPLAVSSPKAVYDLGLGVIERGTNERVRYEVPAQQWAAQCTADGSAGVSILNDCKYGWDKPDDATLRLSLLRSPRVLRKFRHQGIQDHGRHRFVYGIYGHEDRWQISDTCWQAARLNQPLLVFDTMKHDGALGRELSLFQVSSEQVALQALKRAESGNGWIARFRELSGRSAPAFAFGVQDSLHGATEVDGMEDERGPAKVEGHQLEADFAPFALRSFALEISQPDRQTATDARPLDLPFNVVATRRQGLEDLDGFDGRGHSIPAELWPNRVRYGGIDFVLGSADEGVANAVSCQGQEIDLGAHPYKQLHLLVATTGEPACEYFQTQEIKGQLEIGHYSGFLAQRGRPRRLAWPRSLHQEQHLGDDLEVAWIGTHRHGSAGQDEPYIFCYLYYCSVYLPQGCSQVGLPTSPRIHLFAATLANDRIGEITPVHPLYD